MVFNIDYDPAKLPSAQHKGIARTGHVYTKPAVVRAVRALACLLREEYAIKRKLLAEKLGRLEVQKWDEAKDGKPWAVTFEYVYRLASTPKKRRGAAKVTRPDLDNLTKLLLDAVTISGIAFKDDGQVAELHLVKRHATECEPARIAIVMEVLE